MGMADREQPAHYVAVYFFLTVVFLLTALAFVPVGQLCGRLMERLPSLHAYRLNLLGSLGGVALMLGTSFLWTPPAIWFAVCCLGVAAFQAFRPRALMAATLASLAALAVLSWPTNTGWERIYSPYQMLERGGGERGLMKIRAAGHYYQRVHDLSYAIQAISPPDRDARQLLRAALPAAPPAARSGSPSWAPARATTSRRPCAAGARGGCDRDRPGHPGAGADVPSRAALRRPARPVRQRRRAIVPAHDAEPLRPDRLRAARLAHAAEPRLQRAAGLVRLHGRGTPRSAGAGCGTAGSSRLSFAVLSKELGRKIYLMMRAGLRRPPAGLRPRRLRRLGDLPAVEERGPRGVRGTCSLAPAFADVTSVFADPALQADVSTDDWPFFYMPRRVYPSRTSPWSASCSCCRWRSSRSFIGGTPPLQPGVVLLPRRRLHAGRDQGHHRAWPGLRQHLAGDRLRDRRRPGDGVPGERRGGRAANPPAARARPSCCSPAWPSASRWPAAAASRPRRRASSRRC